LEISTLGSSSFFTSPAKSKRLIEVSTSNEMNVNIFFITFRKFLDEHIVGDVYK
jgi:hypothetical protein